MSEVNIKKLMETIEKINEDAQSIFTGNEVEVHTGFGDVYIGNKANSAEAVQLSEDEMDALCAAWQQLRSGAPTMESDDEEKEEWDPENVIPCHACGTPIDFNYDDSADCPNCDGSTPMDYTRGPGANNSR